MAARRAIARAGRIAVDQRAQGNAAHVASRSIARAGRQVAAAAAASLLMPRCLCMLRLRDWMNITTSASPRPTSEFQQTLQEHPNKRAADKIQFDAGAAAYKMKDYDKALQSFSQALLSPDRQLQSRSHYNLGNTLYQRGETQKSERRETQGLDERAPALRADAEDRAGEQGGEGELRVRQEEDRRAEEAAGATADADAIPPLRRTQPAERQEGAEEQDQQQDKDRDQQQQDQSGSGDDKKPQEKQDQSEQKKNPARQDSSNQRRPERLRPHRPGEQRRVAFAVACSGRCTVPSPGDQQAQPSPSPGEKARAHRLPRREGDDSEGEGRRIRRSRQRRSQRTPRQEADG